MPSTHPSSAPSSSRKTISDRVRRRNRLRRSQQQLSAAHGTPDTAISLTDDEESEESKEEESKESS